MDRSISEKKPTRFDHRLGATPTPVWTNSPLYTTGNSNRRNTLGKAVNTGITLSHVSDVSPPGRSNEYLPHFLRPQWWMSLSSTQKIEWGLDIIEIWGKLHWTDLWWNGLEILFWDVKITFCYIRNCFIQHLVLISIARNLSKGSLTS